LRSCDALPLAGAFIHQKRCGVLGSRFRGNDVVLDGTAGHT